MRKLFLMLAFVTLPIPPALAAGGGGIPLDKAHIDLSNKSSLQRGAATFVNFCLSCHSASYMRYNRMAKDLGISEDLLKENLIFGDAKPGDLMITTMPEEDGKEWFGITPPDLSVVARSRGADWLYTYLRSFYLDETAPSGWNNTVFPHVAMPHALYEWQGSQRLKDDHGDGHEDGESKFEIVIPGKLTPAEYDIAMRDLTNFMVYLGEPAKLVRYQMGFWVILFLVIISILTYLLKKEYWRDVH